MKSYSDHMVTPDAQNQAIKDAFQAQNAFMLMLANTTRKNIRVYFAITYITMVMFGVAIGYLLYIK